jgi:hypothetical protein
VPAAGASSPYGAGGNEVSGNSHGIAASGYGAGGSGGFSNQNTNRSGAVGAAGVVVVYEYE